jgi:virginiamycin B lyase
MLRKSLLLTGAVLFTASPALSQDVQLPEGPGKSTIERACVACHSLANITRAGHSREEWNTVLHMMVNAGAQVPQDQFPILVDYLAKNYSARKLPAAAVVPGTIHISIKEWDVPTPGSRPHDPMVAPDGAAWYTGQMANVLGRFDPKTQTFKEYPLKTPNSGPHGLVADSAGNVWFTANFKAYIGKLDPRTGQVTEYPMPDPAARDPHTLLIAPNGNIYFTAQNANMVGRLNPKTGEVKLATSPTPRSNPYGMVVDSHGAPWFVEFGSNKVARIDPDTLEIREFVLPDPASRPRRVAITHDDVIWYSDYSRGYLGRLDPKTGKVTEWPSPGGRQSRPYGITAVGDAIWYSESGTEPNTLVRFDTKTQKFETWTIPSGGGVVRNIDHTPDGNLWLACSGVNKIAFVEIPKATAKN